MKRTGFLAPLLPLLLVASPASAQSSSASAQRAYPMEDARDAHRVAPPLTERQRRNLGRPLSPRDIKPVIIERAPGTQPPAPQRDPDRPR